MPGLVDIIGKYDVNDFGFSALEAPDIRLIRITEDNYADLQARLSGCVDSEAMVSSDYPRYHPQYATDGRQRRFGFLVETFGGAAGLVMLSIQNWIDARGHTSTDILPGMRGRGIAPKTKPLLFYLGFELLGLNRIETGCFVSNQASRRSIEKTPGFRLEGILREYGRNEQGAFEDEYRYAILRSEWRSLYGAIGVTVVA